MISSGTFKTSTKIILSFYKSKSQLFLPISFELEGSGTLVSSTAVCSPLSAISFSFAIFLMNDITKGST